MNRPFDQLSDDQFELAVRHLADAMMFGNDRSRYVGSGIDYAQSRPYSPGDPVKSIDWRVTARSGKVHVKEFESLKHVPVYLVMDQSASMGVTSIDRSKWDWAILLAGAIGLAAVRRSSPVGLISGKPDKNDLRKLNETGHLNFPPSLDRTQIYRWLSHLRRVAPTSCDSCHIAKMLHDLSVIATDASTVIILSDLHEANATRAVARLSQKHEVVVLRLRDPAELAPPVRGMFRAAEAETGRRFFGRGRRAIQPGHDIESDLRSSGVRVMMLPTDQDFIPALREFLLASPFIARAN